MPTSIFVKNELDTSSYRKEKKAIENVLFKVIGIIVCALQPKTLGSLLVQYHTCVQNGLGIDIERIFIFQDCSIHEATLNAVPVLTDFDTVCTIFLYHIRILSYFNIYNLPGMSKSFQNGSIFLLRQKHC